MMCLIHCELHYLHHLRRIAVGRIGVPGYIIIPLYGKRQALVVEAVNDNLGHFVSLYSDVLHRLFEELTI